MGVQSKILTVGNVNKIKHGYNTKFQQSGLHQSRHMYKKCEPLDVIFFMWGPNIISKPLDLFGMLNTVIWSIFKALYLVDLEKFLKNFKPLI